VAGLGELVAGAGELLASVGELVGVAYEERGLGGFLLLLLREEGGRPSSWCGGGGGGRVWVCWEGLEVREEGVSELCASDVACGELLVRRVYWCWRGRWHRGGERLDVLK
jgi:hypothetical protein